MAKAWCSDIESLHHAFDALLNTPEVRMHGGHELRDASSHDARLHWCHPIRRSPGRSRWPTSGRRLQPRKSGRRSWPLQFATGQVRCFLRGRTAPDPCPNKLHDYANPRWTSFMIYGLTRWQDTSIFLCVCQIHPLMGCSPSVRVKIDLSTFACWSGCDKYFSLKTSVLH